MEEYDVAFVGGGLAATLLLNELGPASLGRVAVIDPRPLEERPPIHLSYWSRKPTPYDRFAVGAWRRARVADGRPEPIAPYSLRLVRSTDALAVTAGALEGRTVGGEVVPTPWRGPFWNYQERGGMLVPLSGEVAWLPPEDEKPNWRGRIYEIHHQSAP